MKSTAQKNQKKGLVSRSEWLGTETRPEIDFALRRANRALNSDDVLALLRKQSRQFYELAEVVGKWVWITFEGKQPAEITKALSEYGFHWNNQRQAWQHPGGTLPHRQEFDPRKRYGSQFAADQKAA
jgi:hypothetical protein